MKLGDNRPFLIEEMPVIKDTISYSKSIPLCTWELLFFIVQDVGMWLPSWRHLHGIGRHISTLLREVCREVCRDVLVYDEGCYAFAKA